MELVGKNTIEILDRSKWVGIIGSREASDKECDMAYKLGYVYANSGKIVVSGLAKGIDGAAHRGSLACRDDDKSVALVSTPITDKLYYPKENHDLALEIIERGCVIHLYDTKAKKEDSYFPQFMKRLTERSIFHAHVCETVLIVSDSEGPISGGTKWCAYFAIKLGKTVFRVDSNGKFHANPKVKKPKLNWNMELDIGAAKLWLDEYNNKNIKGGLK